MVLVALTLFDTRGDIILYICKYLVRWGANMNNAQVSVVSVWSRIY